ncbi:MAG: hypothetical protein OXG78_12830 [Chloroflexi bacterium]|nr:hypothetical protein [Chloroflexota bacterium]
MPLKEAHADMGYDKAAWLRVVRLAAIQLQWCKESKGPFAMSEALYRLDIPELTLNRMRQIARENEQSVEAVLIESLNLLYGDFSEEDLSPEALKEYSDEQLVAIVHRRLAWPQNARLRELAALGDEGEISAEELDEMEGLIEVVDYQMLLRSEALLLLKQHGCDIQKHLRLGA